MIHAGIGHAVTYGAPGAPPAVTYPAGSAVPPMFTGVGIAPVTYAASSSGAHYTAPQAVAELEQMRAQLAAKEAECAQVQQQFAESTNQAECLMQNTMASHQAHANQKEAEIKALNNELNATKQSLADHSHQVQNLAALNAGAQAQLSHANAVATGVTYAHNHLQQQRAVTYAAAAAPMVVHPHAHAGAITYGAPGVVAHPGVMHVPHAAPVGGGVTYMH